MTSKKVYTDEQVEHELGEELASLSCENLKKVGWHFFKDNNTSTRRLEPAASKVTTSYTEFVDMSKREAIVAILYALIHDTRHSLLVLQIKGILAAKINKKQKFLDIFGTFYAEYAANLQTHQNALKLRATRPCLTDQVLPLNPGYCPTGYTSIVRAAGACCKIDNRFGVPVKWAVNVERQMETALNTSFVHLLKLNIERKFQSNTGDKVSIEGCKDSSAALQYWLGITYNKDKLKRQSKAVLKALIDAVPAKDTLQKAAQVLSDGLNKIVAKMQTALVGDLIKARVLQVVTSYLLKTGVLAAVEYPSGGVSGNHRSAFAVEVCAKYQAMRAKTDCKESVAEDLFNIYTTTVFPHISFIKKVAKDTSGEIIKELVRGVADTLLPGLTVLGDTFMEAFKETSEETLDTVILLFFETKLRPNVDTGVVDILTYIVRVFDLASSLRSNPVVATRFPVIVKWADNIELEYDPDNEEVKLRNDRFTKIGNSLQSFTRCMAHTVGSAHVKPECVLDTRGTMSPAAVGGAGGALGGHSHSRRKSVVIRPLS
jgi:hypothetical protein